MDKIAKLKKIMYHKKYMKRHFFIHVNKKSSKLSMVTKLTNRTDSASTGRRKFLRAANSDEELFLQTSNHLIIVLERMSTVCLQLFGTETFHVQPTNAVKRKFRRGNHTINCC